MIMASRNRITSVVKDTGTPLSGGRDRHCRHLQQQARRRVGGAPGLGRGATAGPQAHRSEPTLGDDSLRHRGEFEHVWYGNYTIAPTLPQYAVSVVN